MTVILIYFGKFVVFSVRQRMANMGRRRWRFLLAEAAFAAVLFTAAVFIARPVFLTPLQAEPEAPLTAADLLASLNRNTILGFAPDVPPYAAIMLRVAELLKTPIINASSEYHLNNILYKSNKMAPDTLEKSVIWIIWKSTENNMWKVNIRSTERARYQTSTEFTAYPNPHLRAGFLAVQVAISQAIIEYSSTEEPKYEVNLVSMPVSPLMQEEQVKKALSGILMCFTLALMPPVLETQALVVGETGIRFKRGLRIRGVAYSSMYLGWLTFAGLTALPICFLASITMLLIFRWIHLLFALMLLLAYITVMNIIALIMAMFHRKALVACVWSSLFTLLQTYVSEVLVHHELDMMHAAVTFLMHVLMPPLGLVHAMNEFALLQTGHSTETKSFLLSLLNWLALMLFYFTLLMFLQRTIGRERAIGGQVSWKTLIFKKIEDANQLHKIENPTGMEREKLQEVDELVAKAVSFKNVSKSIMGVEVLSEITLDIYRGEYTMLFVDQTQEKMVVTLEDLLTGLTFADRGTINVLGHILRPARNYMTRPHMMGYCHLSNFLIQDLTVAEHFALFNNICMWSETRQYIYQYGSIRTSRLLEECDLKTVQNEQVSRLDHYYCAQLCWALAMLLEPKIVILPDYSYEHHRFKMVIKDKIMEYKKYMTLIQMCYSTVQLEYADRVFIFDRRVLCFGGTPAYMFFKYGREYRVRLKVQSDGSFEDERLAELIRRATRAGATIRSHLGSFLVLRLPASPTEAVADLVRDLTNNEEKYGAISMHISVPDSEEVYRRAMLESSVCEASASNEEAKEALQRIAEPQKWERQDDANNFTLLRVICWKYFTCHIHYRHYLLITLLSALLAGIFIGLSLSSLLAKSERDEAAKKLLHGEILTMEFTGKPTTLVLRSDRSSHSTSLVNAYVLSEPNATMTEVKRISYTALDSNESLTEYLVTRAIDSPKLYVSVFAYGIDVKNENETLKIQALYSPLHKDQGAAARSLAKMFTAVLRHYTGMLNATIQITDDPLALDLSPWMRYASRPPLLVQFLLILITAHVLLIPSLENGLIRHTQSHAMNFTPARYWLSLYFCDLVFYWILVAVTTGVMMLMMYLVAPEQHFQYEDLLVVPFTLVMYGFASVPQAYLFSLGPRVTFNSMTFIIVNIVFGETTIIAKLFSGEVLKYTLLLLSLSPQFNMAHAFVKIKQIFLYNSECIIFETQNFCSNKVLHKCCKRCGILQECFTKRNYLSRDSGILTEVLVMAGLGVLFMGILMLLEYKVFQLVWKYFTKEMIDQEESGTLQPGVVEEKRNVLNKWTQIKERAERNDSFGEYLLARNITRKEQGVYTTRSVYLGLKRGETLSLAGLKRHERLTLLELLAGVRFPDQGQAYVISKWNLTADPHQYCRNISICYDREPLPPWMRVRDALELVALLRGVPKSYVKDELKNIIDALELNVQADQLISQISQKSDRMRLHFAAAVVGAPPIIMLDECTANQTVSVRRAMYWILHHLRRRGHAVLVSSSSVEAHMPITDRLAIMVDGAIFDIDTIDSLVGRHSSKGYTVVLHIKDEIDARAAFARHFRVFVINDTTEVLVNVQVLDADLNWATMFEKMEALKKKNREVYSYIITAIPIDYIYNSIINNEKGYEDARDNIAKYRLKWKRTVTKIKPSKKDLDALVPFKRKYDIMRLEELPWSVIFHT